MVVHDGPDASVNDRVARGRAVMSASSIERRVVKKLQASSRGYRRGLDGYRRRATPVRAPSEEIVHLSVATVARQSGLVVH